MTQTNEEPGRVRVILAFAAIYIIWGSTFYGVSIALKGFPPFLLSALRLLLAGSVLIGYCLIKRDRFPSLNDVLKNAACGVVIFVGGIVAVVWAQQHIQSSLASIIITTPFWFVILDKSQWKFYFSSKWILAGLVIGLIGVIFLLGFKKGAGLNSDNDDMQAISILIMIAGSAMWVMGSLYLKYNPTDTSVYINTSIQLLSAGLFCLLLSTLNHEPQTVAIDHISLSSWLALLYLSLVSSLIAFMAFIWLIKIKPPAVVSTYSYVNPLVAVLLGWKFGNEEITSYQLIALALILSGVLFVNIPKYKTV